MPDYILSRMETAKTKEDGLKTGLEIAKEMKDNLKNYVSGYQVNAPFGKVEYAVEVLKD